MDLARGSFRNAVAHFDAALGRAADYVPALVGRGDALLATDDVGAAIESFEAALAVNPGLARVDRLVGELRFRVMSERHAQARAAVAAGRLTEAEAAYADMIAASPESAFLYLELAEIHERRGRPEEALAQTRRARRLDPNDVEAVLMEAALLEELGDLESAEHAVRVRRRGQSDRRVGGRTAAGATRLAACGTAGRVPWHRGGGVDHARRFGGAHRCAARGAAGRRCVRHGDADPDGYA